RGSVSMADRWNNATGGETFRFFTAEQVDQILRDGARQGRAGSHAAIERILKHEHGLERAELWQRIRELKHPTRQSRVRRSVWSAEDDQLLRMGYEEGWAGKQKAVRELLKRHPDWRPHIVWRRAAKLGLTHSSPKRKRERAGCTWSEHDDRILLNLAGYKQAKVIAKILHRSESAVRYRLAVLGKSSRFHKEGYARRALAEELHLGIRTVQRLIVDGLLEVRDPRITNRSLRELSKALRRPDLTTEITPRMDGAVSELPATSEGPQPGDVPVSPSCSLGPFPTRASRAKRFWIEAATALGVSLETVEQYILKGVLKLCDPRITENSLRRFCRRNGSLINSDFLNQETRSWLKDAMDLVPNAGKTETGRFQASRKHARTVRKCGCGRAIRGNAFFRHSRRCPQASSEQEFRND
ncbi:MAG: hypothetical protein L0338_01115, partial [Acidobacteria bacterium]|nr:hypothetical protein [Acidobacteriota bacterium]